MVTATKSPRARSSKSQAAKAPRPADLLRRLRKLTPGSEEFNETYGKIIESKAHNTRSQLDLHVIRDDVMQLLHPELVEAVWKIDVIQGNEKVVSLLPRIELFSNGWFPRIGCYVNSEYESIDNPEAETLASDVAKKLRAFAKRINAMADKIEAGKEVEA